jgi:hypothetical protein
VSFRLLLLALGGVLLFAGVAGTSAARANGVPQLVKLTYLEGVSNFGPEDGEGVLEFSFAEAYARIEVKNLVPVEGYSYEGWMLGDQASPFRVGPITVEPSGIGTFESKLAGLERYDYNLFVVAARPEGASETSLPAEVSIAGRFAVIADGEADLPGDVRPDLLPDTGEPPAGRAWGRYLMTGLVMGGTALVVFGILRRRAEGRKS